MGLNSADGKEIKGNRKQMEDISVLPFKRKREMKKTSKVKANEIEWKKDM